MTTFTAFVVLVLIGCLFVWSNERRYKNSPNDGILRDVVVKYENGTMFRFYQVKPVNEVTTIRSYRISPDLSVLNSFEIEAILKYKDYLEECGLKMTVEKAAEIWIRNEAESWRKKYQEQLKEISEIINMKEAE